MYKKKAINSPIGFGRGREARADWKLSQTLFCLLKLKQNNFHGIPLRNINLGEWVNGI